MADAKKCDSCGNYWDNGYPNIPENELIVGSTNKTEVTNVRITLTGDGFKKELDLCGSCMRGFGQRNRRQLLPWSDTSTT